MQQRKLDVVMTVYNNVPYIHKAVESILGQSFSDFRLFIINDGSSDETGAVVDGYAARDSRISVVHQENQGNIAAANRGFSLSDAELVARMDGDDIALPDRFAKQVAFLDAHPDVGVLGTWITVMDEHDSPRTGGENNPAHHDELMERLDSSTPIMNPTAMIRKSVIDRIGGYRPAYKHCEDYDFWLRCAEVCKLANLPERLLYYRYYDGQVSRKYAVVQSVATIIAYAAYQRRLAGLPDPTEGLSSMPDLATLSGMFGDRELPRNIRNYALRDIDYNIAAFEYGATEFVAEAITEGDFPGLMRAMKIAARLIQDGQAGNGLRIARAALLRM